MKPNPAIVALSFGAFGIGVTEFAPMGLLPGMAADLGVSIPVAGLLVSGYAAGVMLGAPFMTLGTTRLPRKTLLILLMGIFAVGNLLSALSGSYGLLLFARVVTSLAHGAFFGVGSIVAASVVAPDRRAGAVAAMFMGLTIANVVGVPLAAWVGEAVGWRAVFFAIAAVGVVAMLALARALPQVAGAGAIDVRRELRVMADRRVLTALAVTMLQSAAMFTVFTYIAPILRDATHASTAFVSAMLVIFGLGLTLGNWLGGRAADRSVRRTTIVGLVSLAALLLLFAVTMHWAVPAAISIFLWGVATFALIPPLQLSVMQAASDAPNLASSTNIGAFNLGNALGAAIGGAVIGAGMGYPAVAVAGAGMAVASLLLLLGMEAIGGARQRAVAQPC
ncbi:DHA1 family inner membrane transport protein [Sphingomonas zeicaulis]|uniref:MFS transporter n=1 Tax=Sphingomonas zeicaulis TaxID=1632740 RepID=UPI003D1C3CC8